MTAGVEPNVQLQKKGSNYPRASSEHMLSADIRREFLERLRPMQLSECRLLHRLSDSICIDACPCEVAMNSIVGTRRDFVCVGRLIRALTHESLFLVDTKACLMVQRVSPSR